MVVESRRMSRSTISDWLECKKTAFFAPVERSERLEGVGGREGIGKEAAMLQGGHRATITRGSLLPGSSPP
jgi:hypothetical protein